MQRGFTAITLLLNHEVRSVGDVGGEQERDADLRSRFGRGRSQTNHIVAERRLHLVNRQANDDLIAVDFAGVWCAKTCLLVRTARENGNLAIAKARPSGLSHRRSHVDGRVRRVWISRILEL